MNITFTQEDFEKFVNEVEEVITVKLSEEEIKNLTMAIAKTRGSDFSDNDVINALEHYKRDVLRNILWRTVLKGMINLYISEDGSDIAFVPDRVDE